MKNFMGVSAIIAAGGKGTRMGAAENKVFLKLGNKEIIKRTTEIFENNPLISEIIIVTGEDDIQRCREIVNGFKKVKAVVVGGETRRQSVFNGIKMASENIIAIHDAARALLEDNIINATIAAAEKYGAAAPGVLCKDTLKTADDKNFISGTLDRNAIYQIQTPQIFQRDIIIKAHENADFEATDDCALVENEGVKIKITGGSYENIKLTTPEDMIIGESILQRRKNL